MLYFITSNQNKIAVAKTFLGPLGIPFQPKDLDLIEIQSDDFAKIALYKAKQAFGIIKEPLFISDHAWSIPALNGFPGAYMKYMNNWFTPQDFLKLMEGKDNRDIFLTETLCFIDKNGPRAFSKRYKGSVLYEKQGEGTPAMTVTSLTKDGISLAKKWKENPSALKINDVYTEFASWLKNTKKY